MRTVVWQVTRTYPCPARTRFLQRFNWPRSSVISPRTRSALSKSTGSCGSNLANTSSSFWTACARTMNSSSCSTRRASLARTDTAHWHAFASRFSTRRKSLWLIQAASNVLTRAG
ncbi:hypothetical protein DPMN_103456 [Dreissena polymorpha]|uniref:Uncharacterized protein n=1 Tax=Dreissena polymorpha TaxID=45954 RepID=A0A9D4H832_DREPO|nr:hypothetical protein DPMN_103456 [Dreissena polymorpha]